MTHAEEVSSPRVSRSFPCSCARPRASRAASSALRATTCPTSRASTRAARSYACPRPRRWRTWRGWWRRSRKCGPWGWGTAGTHSSSAPGTRATPRMSLYRRCARWGGRSRASRGVITRRTRERGSITRGRFWAATGSSAVRAIDATRGSSRTPPRWRCRRTRAPPCASCWIFCATSLRARATMSAMSAMSPTQRTRLRPRNRLWTCFADCGGRRREASTTTETKTLITRIRGTLWPRSLGL